MRLSSVLLRVQDDLADPAAEERERARRAWHFAERRERLPVTAKIKGATLFEGPIPSPPATTCTFPGCNRVRRRNGRRGFQTLCDSHSRQKSRHGLLQVKALGLPTPRLGPEGPCRRGHFWEVYRDRHGHGVCRACVRERARKRRAGK